MKRAFAVALLIAAMAASVLLPHPEHYAEERLHAALGRALAAFALGRSLDGLISVAQGTEVAIEPAGVGVTLAPGQILDPVNDLVEQFSSLMLVASASLGVQELLLGIGAWWPLKLVTAGLLLITAIIVLARKRVPVPLAWVAAVLLLTRFAVPAAALASEAGWQLLLAGPFASANAELEKSSEILSAQVETTPATAEPDSGWIGSAERWWQSTRETMDPRAKLAAIENAADRIVGRLIELIAVFTLESLIFPLLFLAAILRTIAPLSRWLANAGQPPPAELTNEFI